MNPFTHAQNFETPGFYMCSIVMCQKLWKSANQSLNINTWQQEAVSVVVLRIGTW
jgi:hypothetical protein